MKILVIIALLLTMIACITPSKIQIMCPIEPIVVLDCPEAANTY